MTTILGIDEAGRGSVIGPMYIGGVVIDEKDSAKLKALGVKDSKLLTPEKRESLYPKIKRMAKDFVVLKVTAKQIDEMRKTTNLNKIEAQEMAEIIKAMKADKAYIDAPQVSTEKFRDILLAMVKNHTEIIAENHADVKFPVVSAAAILAKVERDRDVERIKKIVGFDFGVGYPHDQRSIDFVKKALKEEKHLEFIRHSWVTVHNLKNEKEQKTLKEYRRNK